MKERFTWQLMNTAARYQTLIIFAPWVQFLMKQMDNKAKNKNLHKAKGSKKDEFYTQLPDIERELKHYKNHFKGKVVYCNCDDPRVSNFFHFFSYNFEKFELRKLIATCYKNQDMDLFSQNASERAIYLVLRSANTL